MKLSPAVVAMLLTVFMTVGLTTVSSCGDILRFPSTITVHDYVRLQSTLSAPLTAVTACVRMRTDEAHSGTLFSYATQRYQNEFLFFGDTSHTTFSVSIQFSGTGSVDLQVLDGMWHLVCFTWKSSSGDWKMYTDGRVVGSGTGYAVGRSVNPGGVWVLGQEQDSPGGSFQINQAFRGDISSFNVWDDAMTDSQILQLLINVTAYRGSVLDWETVGKLVYGEAQLYRVECEISLGQDRCNITDDEICNTAYNNTITEPHRSSEFVPGAGDSLICDNGLAEGWYRFEAHSQSVQIPEGCVPEYHCGTQVPLWLDGTHPISSQVAVKEVCANYGVSGNCCSHRTQIRIKRCTADGGNVFYAYCLSPTSGCSQAYCAGNQLPCPAGHVWGNEYGKCVNETPSITENPVLHPPVINLTTWKVTFTCEVKYDKDFDDGARFAVKFLFDHVEYPEVNDATESPLDPTKKTVELDAKYLGEFVLFGTHKWHSKMGKTVSCLVHAYWKDFKHKKSRDLHSNGYYAGIKADKTHLEIPEGKSDTIKLHSTVPFLCDDKLWFHENNCVIDIGIEVSDDVTPEIDCAFQIRATNWNPTTLRAESEEKTIYATQDPIDGDRVNALVFKIFPNAHFHHDIEGDFVPSTYSGYTPDDIHVEVKTIDGGQPGHCKGVTDPHYTTFDGKYYTILFLGEFLFYKSQERNFEVQVRTWYCGDRGATCHCAVAVREGNDIVIIDLCHVGWGNHHYAYPKITEKTAGKEEGILSPGVAVYRDATNKRFEIFMPSATSVVAEINKWGIDVHAYAPATDLGNTLGLCGTWDGDSGNDFTQRSGIVTGDENEFGNSWRVPRGTSLFDVACPEIDPNATETVRSCNCEDGGNIRCRYDENAKRNTLRGINNEAIPQKDSANLQCGGTARRSRRSTHDVTFYSDDIDESEGYVFDYGNNQPPPPVAQWPTPTLQLTEADAVRHCREAITNSSISAVCANLGVDIFAPVEACVEDIKFTEDLGIAAAHVDTMKASCTDIAYQNVSLYDVGDDGVAVPPMALRDNLCPADCSQHGDCVNGNCVCFEPYTSADCSLVKGSPPVAMFIPNHGLCDIRRRPCRKTSIIADGLIESENLTCRIRDVKIENGLQTIVPGSDQLTNATIRSFKEVSCALPRSPLLLGTPDDTEGTIIYGYRISVSNDGENFSDELLFTIYDSVCQNCTSGPQCFWKLNTCKIRNFCFGDGDPNPNNWCQQCLPQLSNQTFSERPLNLPPVIVSPTDITKVNGENLTFIVVANDPESRPVSVAVTSANTHAIPVNGDQVQWKTDHPVGSFVETIKASDECGASDAQNFTFITMDCPCQNNGRCVPDPNMPRGQGHYVCECPGYSGQWCEQEIDECQSNPCHNGTCVDLINGFNCTCDADHLGEFCHIDVDDKCGLQPCFPGVLCINVAGGFECGDCPEGFTGNGIICEDVDECALDTTNDCNYVCENSPGSYRCTCSAGFVLINDQCFDIDECAYGLSECSHLCVNNDGSYTCDCPAGYLLGPDNKQCTELDECDSTPCQNGGSCHDGINQFSCSCPLGWLGTLCERDIDECLVTNHGCENDCENTPGSYTCSCPEGFELKDDRRTCQDTNECETSYPCTHICINTDGSYICSCPSDLVLQPDGITCVVPASAVAPQESTQAQETTLRPSASATLGTNTETPQDCRKSDCPDKQLQECVEVGGNYVCQCVEGYYLAEGGTMCKESTVYDATITLAMINGNEAVFTEDGLGTPGSPEFLDLVLLMEEVINAAYESSDLEDQYRDCKVNAFRQGSVIVNFDLFFVEDADLSSSEVMDAIFNSLANNTLSGGNGMIVAIPSSLQVSSQATTATEQMWYNNPLYLSLLCVGCAVVVTILIVGAVCLLTSPNRRRKMVISDSTVAMNMADMNGKAEGIDGPAAEDDKY
ncbi:von Willebrand factor D and EGF domain-containing protein-like isoform X1 [Branchiostoma lanceolatum]|uniref:von Willebrand factor D and EGF domain-containing protein-like isoform X1 n=1 Tax=Branchiostoma lanceolatum TaxID=7740 RepID=UPI003455D2EF